MQPVTALSGSHGAYQVRPLSFQSGRPGQAVLRNVLTASPPAWAKPDLLTFSPGALALLSRLRASLMATMSKEYVQARQVQQMLQTTALPNAERVVARDLGLRADNAPLTIFIERDMGGALGSASGWVTDGGRLDRLELRFNLKAFTPDTRSNGRNAHVENDRIVAHELTHLVMARTMDFADLPEWFLEGTAEYVAGAAERTRKAYRAHGFSLLKLPSRTWQNTSEEYAAAYLAVRYLDERTQASGGIKGIMTNLAAGHSLDEAVRAGGVFESIREFLGEFQGPAGRRWLAGLDLTGAGAKSARHGARVVADHQQPARFDPLVGFQERWAPLPVTQVLQAYSFWSR